MKLAIFMLAAGALPGVLPCFAQSESVPKSIAESIADPLRYTEGDLLAAADAMPEAKYAFVPTAGNFKDARSFGEQIKHVACAHFAFFNEIAGKTPPAHCWNGGPAKAATKAELIKYLKDSFDYGHGVVAGINATNAVARVEGPYAAPNTRLGIAIVAVWHLSDHYGQLVEYLRMNDIVPPATKKYPLPVR